MGVMSMVRNEAHERARMRAGRKEIRAVFHFEKARKKKQDCNSRKNNAAAPFSWHRKFFFFLSILSHDCSSLNEAFTRYITGGKSNWEEKQCSISKSGENSQYLPKPQKHSRRCKGPQASARRSRVLRKNALFQSR